MNEYFIWEKLKIKSSIKIIDGLKENRTSRDFQLNFPIQLSQQKTTKNILTPSNHATKNRITSNFLLREDFSRMTRVSVSVLFVTL
jgi:hypothetical protein